MELLDRDQFRAYFADSALLLADLPSGQGKDIAAQVKAAGTSVDGSLHTRPEHDALFGLLLKTFEADPNATALTVTDNAGPTPAGRIVATYRQAAIDKDRFFAEPMYLADVTGWTGGLYPKQPVEAAGAAQLSLSRTNPSDPRHLPPVDDRPLFASTTFSLVNSGNRTLYASKPSWKVKLDIDGAGDNDRVVGMSTLNLKSMFNDPSQMREALAWQLFGLAGVPGSRQTYAKLGIDGNYRGLFSVTEEVDRRFLRDRFGANSRGNLYKAGCGDLGCATLEHRTDSTGDDSGRQYRSVREDDQTYRLRTNEDDAAANSFDDLAAFIRVINAVGLPGGDDRFDTDAFQQAVEQIMNGWSFLRWAGVNLLLGSWDNYFATPSNYYLYNSGLRGAERQFMSTPYFTFIPWDYDNSFGVTYVETQWQYTDIIDWPSSTRVYWNNRGTSRLPLVQNLLRNTTFLRYYLDHLEHLLDTEFNPATIRARIAPQGGGLWDLISTAAYLESDTPTGNPHTGRLFSNHEVYLNGQRQDELRRADRMIEGIYHYTVMRYDSARAQLAVLRGQHPAGSSGAAFTGTMETLPQA